MFHFVQIQRYKIIIYPCFKTHTYSTINELHWDKERERGGGGETANRIVREKQGK